MKNKICEYCGNEFFPNNRNSKFCDTVCYSESKKERQAEKRAELKNLIHTIESNYDKLKKLHDSNIIEITIDEIKRHQINLDFSIKQRINDDDYYEFGRYYLITNNNIDFIIYELHEPFI